MLERREIGARHELVDVRQRRHQPLRARLEARPTRERIEPDHPATRAPKRRHLARELRWIVALPAIGHDDHHGSTANRASHPAAVELVQARADARPPPPVHHPPPPALERRVGVAHPQLAREDRKSTRLKSRHGYISYAGFFFKKKKKKNRDTDVIIS